MNGTADRFFRLSGALSALVILGWVLTGHAAKPAPEGLPTDWSHRHIIFSQPGTTEQVRLVTSDPRYWQQWYRRNVARVLSVDAAEPGDHSPMGFGSPLAINQPMHQDWSEDLGPLGTAGAGNFPAKYSFQINQATCGDLVVLSTGLTGATGQASIVAYNNLYVGGCAGAPTTYWAYNTGGQILTSPVIAPGGTQVAFVQTNASNQGTLVLLKWAASNGTVFAPVTPTLVSNAAYRNYPAPCMTTIALANGVDDRTSSAFPDYTHDVIWVGGTAGWLHKITGVFRGTPTEVTTGGFPVQVNAGATALSSPVYDYASGNVFVGDLGGFLYRVTNASPPVVTASARVDYGVGLVAGPIVDSTAEVVYVFSSNDNNTTGSCAPAPCSGVFQFGITGFTGGSGTEIAVGTSCTPATCSGPSFAPNPLYEGSFDNAYHASGNRTGALLVCGDTGVNPILYRVPINAGAFGTVGAVAPLTGAGNHPACSPVTDLFNPNGSGGAEERVFFSTTQNANPAACTPGGCAMSFVTMPWQAGTVYNVGQEILIYRPQNGVQYINVVTQAGTSGGSAPNWRAAVGAVITNDGSVHWINQGATQVAVLAAWQATHAYALRARIPDTNGNIQVVSTGGAGTSGATEPATWGTPAGATTNDGTVIWTNAGVLPSAALPAAGGTSGIIIDNIAGSATMAGASQVYYSTLANQACTGGSGGCAVQATQSALQ